MIRVLVVEDHELVRELIQDMLGSTPDIRVVGAAGTAEEAIRQARELAPDVVLMDIGLPGTDGAQAAQVITGRASAPRVVLLTALGRERFPRHAQSCGAVGFVVKRSSFVEMIDAVRYAANNRPYFDPELVRRMARDEDERDRRGEAPGAMARDLVSHVARGHGWPPEQDGAVLEAWRRGWLGVRAEDNGD